jgi:HAE1 family hydrophobic/amphiphilic exporter-1
MTAVRRLTIFALLVLCAFAGFAQESASVRTTDPVTAGTDRDANDPRALRLSLDEAIRTAMNQNLGVQLQTYEYRISGQTLRSEYGLFDWIAAAEASQSSQETPTGSIFASDATRSTIVNASVNQIIPTGGQYSVGWTNSRTSVSGGGTFINPQYRSGLQLSFTQPLMRDFGIDITRRGITFARNNLGITEGSFRTALMDTVSSVEQAYLDLIYARRQVDVVKESLFLARDQARIVQIRIDVGAAAPLDILQPRVSIATTEEQLIGAVASVRNAEDRLRALLNLPEADWSRPIIPTDDVTFQRVSIDLDQAVARAIDNRPEMSQQRLDTENRRLQALYTRNQTLPTLDFGLGYDVAGLAGRQLELDGDGEPTGRVLSTGYGDAVSQLFGRDYPAWNIGVNFGIPIRNIGARATARAAELDLEQAVATTAQTRQNIAVEVRAAARAVDTYAQAIEATRAAREAAERNLEAERRRYENGMTTNFQVLEVQQQLTDARVRELAALVGYNKAVAAYHRAIGDILEVHQIQVGAPADIQEPQATSFFDRYDWLYYGNRSKKEEPNNDQQ